MVEIHSHVANPSNQAQTRWVTVPMPLAVAAMLPDECLVDGKWPAIRASRVGDCSQLWHVKVHVAAHAETELIDWQPIPADYEVPPFEMSGWITDDPTRMVLSVHAFENGQWLNRLALNAGTLVESNKVSQLWRFDRSGSGFHATVFARFWAGQDAVDIRGGVTWSDPTRAEMALGDATIAVQTGDWRVDGEELWLYYSRLGDFRRWENHTWRIFRGGLPHGCTIPFTGVILPSQDITPSTALPISFEGQAKAPLALRRAVSNSAARNPSGPLIAATEWDDSWFGFGTVVRTTERANQTEVIDFFTNTRQPIGAERKYANGLYHGQTGSQPTFACSKGHRALNGDPWHLQEVIYSADDYLLRGFAHRKPDGARLLVNDADYRDVQTWSGSIEYRASPNPFGKSRQQPWGWDKLGPRCILADDQHRGDGYILAAYALTGDPMLKESLLDTLACDEMRAKPARGQYDAPRSSGRLMQSWSKAMIALPEERERYLALAQRELLDCNTHRVHGTPISPQQILVDDRQLPGEPAWMAWQHSLQTLGLMELEATLQLFGDPNAASYGALADELARLVVEYAMVWHSIDGEWSPILTVKWLSGGAVNPGLYYTYPRSGAWPHDQDPGYDMKVGARYWFDWMASSIVRVSEMPLEIGGVVDPIVQRAIDIRQHFDHLHLGHVNTASWWAFR